MHVLFILLLLVIIAFYVVSHKNKTFMNYNKIIFQGDNINELEKILNKYEYELTNNENGELIAVNEHGDEFLIEVDTVIFFRGKHELVPIFVYYPDPPKE